MSVWHFSIRQCSISVCAISRSVETHLSDPVWLTRLEWMVSQTRSDSPFTPVGIPMWESPHSLLEADMGRICYVWSHIGKNNIHVSSVRVGGDMTEVTLRDISGIFPSDTRISSKMFTASQHFVVSDEIKVKTNTLLPCRLWTVTREYNARYLSGFRIFDVSLGAGSVLSCRVVSQRWPGAYLWCGDDRVG